MYLLNRVYIYKETGAIVWSNELEMDSNNIYLKKIGKSFDEWKNVNLEYASN